MSSAENSKEQKRREAKKEIEEIKKKLERAEKKFERLMGEIDTNLSKFSQDDLILYGTFSNRAI